MIADGDLDFFVQPFSFGIIAAHQALQFRELADHFGYQIGLGQFRRQPGLGLIGPNGFGDFTGQRFESGQPVQPAYPVSRGR